MLTARLTSLFAALAVAAPAGFAFAAGDHGGGHGGGHGDAAAIGAPGEAAEVARTIEVAMKDIAYEPESISVEAGETIRFVIANEGDLVHEFNIGTAEMHEAHQDEMMAMFESGALELTSIDRGAMDHDDPSSALLEPGASGELVWRFPEEGEIEFACNVPGHYQAGMHGDIALTR